MTELLEANGFSYFGYDDLGWIIGSPWCVAVPGCLNAQEHRWRRLRYPNFTPFKIMSKLKVIFEDNHLLVVDKPALLATMGTKAGEDSLYEQAKLYLKKKYNKPGNVFVGVVSRLDSFVSGVVVLARTSKAASRLSQQFREGTVEKKYWAIVPTSPESSLGESGRWQNRVPNVRAKKRHGSPMFVLAEIDPEKAALQNRRPLQKIHSTCWKSVWKRGASIRFEFNLKMRVVP
jgi:23S rRNA-/tRNA-specific pseudouridylate synthase